MSIIRYTPKQDAFIISAIDKQNINTGLDEILEIGNVGGKDSCARALLDFGDVKVPAGIVRCTLHLFVAETHNLIQPEYRLKVGNVGQSWTEGYGKYGDCPSTQKGVSWKHRDFKESTWVEEGGNVLEAKTYVTETFDSTSKKDVNLNVTKLLQEKGTVGGFIVLFENEKEALDTNASISFYSKDTHTIYAPYLEIEISDSEYDAGKQSVITTEQVFISPVGLKSIQNTAEKLRVRLSVAPKYPARVYSTTSLYKNSYILPEMSYWGIQNEYTREMVVDFCEGTRISVDSEGSYFDIDFSILEPERYYRLLIQVNIDVDRRVIFDNRNVFKIITIQGSTPVDGETVPYVVTLPKTYSEPIPYGGKNLSFVVKTNQEEWNVVSSDPDNFKVSVISSGFTVTVSENRDVFEREATLTVSAGTAPHKLLKLVQEAAPIPKEKEFVLVKDMPDSWEGTFLIVWGTGAHATVTSKDLEKTTDVYIDNERVVATEQVRQAAVGVTKLDSGYSIQLPDNRYLNVKTASNQVAASTDRFPFDITLCEDSTVLLTGVDVKGSTRVICKNGNFVRGYVGKELAADYVKPQLFKLKE